MLDRWTVNAGAIRIRVIERLRRCSFSARRLPRLRWRDVELAGLIVHYIPWSETAPPANASAAKRRRENMLPEPNGIRHLAFAKNSMRRNAHSSPGFPDFGDHCDHAG